MKLYRKITVFASERFIWQEMKDPMKQGQQFQSIKQSRPQPKSGCFFSFISFCSNSFIFMIFILYSSYFVRWMTRVYIAISNKHTIIRGARR